jgi:hypothetical protein
LKRTPAFAKQRFHFLIFYGSGNKKITLTFASFNTTTWPLSLCRKAGKFNHWIKNKSENYSVRYKENQFILFNTNNDRVFKKLNSLSVPKYRNVGTDSVEQNLQVHDTSFTLVTQK